MESTANSFGNYGGRQRFDAAQAATVPSRTKDTKTAGSGHGQIPELLAAEIGVCSGLVPSWADDPEIGYKLIDARSEEAAKKPSFRGAMKARRFMVDRSASFTALRESRVVPHVNRNSAVIW
jgi:hypothetical protein